MGAAEVLSALPRAAPESRKGGQQSSDMLSHRDEVLLLTSREPSSLSRAQRDGVLVCGLLAPVLRSPPPHSLTPPSPNGNTPSHTRLVSTLLDASPPPTSPTASSSASHRASAKCASWLTLQRRMAPSRWRSRKTARSPAALPRRTPGKQARQWQRRKRGQRRSVTLLLRSWGRACRLPPRSPPASRSAASTRGADGRCSCDCVGLFPVPSDARRPRGHLHRQGAVPSIE